jgi:hypothetical protein
MSPADPSIAAYSGPTGYKISYAANAHVFATEPSLTSTFRDGRSQTILFAEHYFWCGPTKSNYSTADPYKGPTRRPTFADGGSVLGGENPGDVYPVTSGVPPVTRPSQPGVTFQVQPRTWVPDKPAAEGPRAPERDECNTSLPQTPHSGGMLVVTADGGIRIVSPSISPEAFWSAVTPAGGEVVSGDW